MSKSGTLSKGREIKNVKHFSFNRVKHGQRIVAHVNVLISNHFPVHLDLFGQILPVTVFQKSQYLIPL